MIFITVGTHEQQFNRLVECIDKLVEKGKIKEEAIIQTGFSTYEPKYCKWRKLFPYSEMQELVTQARIIITHGGPSSFIAPLQIGKIPIVIPRNHEYGEHVNNHQLNFCRAVSERMGTIIVVEDINQLGVTIEKYDEIVSGMKGELKSNNEKFCVEFEKIVDQILK